MARGGKSRRVASPPRSAASAPVRSAGGRRTPARSVVVRRAPSTFTSRWTVKYPSRPNNAVLIPHILMVFKNNNSGTLSGYRPNVNIYGRVARFIRPVFRARSDATRATRRQVLRNALLGLGIPPEYLYMLIANVLQGRRAAQAIFTERDQRWHTHAYKIKEWNLLMSIVREINGGNRILRPFNQNRNRNMTEYLNRHRLSIPMTTEELNAYVQR